MKWIAFFSKTGSELVHITDHFNREPDLIVTNRKNLDGCHSGLIECFEYFPNKFKFIRSSPTIEEYWNVLNQFKGEDVIITLHGYMRIVPSEICDAFEIYNGHPGLITKYPELKGKDPQRKAWLNGYKTSGCVIHRVTPELDGGPIVAQVEADIDNLTLDNVISTLHTRSINLWIEFLTKKLFSKQDKMTPLSKAVNKEILQEVAVEYCEKHYPETLKELRRLQEEEFLLFCKKQFDYGPGNIAVGQDTTTADGKKLSLYSIIFRCNDKVQRLLNLMVKNNATAQNEPAMDAFSDLSLYGKIAKIVDKGVWGK